MSLNLQPAELQAAQALLRQFLCVNPQPLPALDQVRQALQQVGQHSDYQIFGVCADDWEQAAIALISYLRALGYEDHPEITPREGAVYIKYNPKQQRCHIDSYTGRHRGVLVSCQSAYDGDVNETFGHLPLDLFLEL
jgi:hypothetical protein